MPPSEVRPVGPRAVFDSRSSSANEIGRGSRAESFRTCRTSPSPWQRTCRSGPQVGGEVLVGRGEQHPDAGAGDELAQVEREHLGERPVQVAANSSAMRNRGSAGVSSAGRSPRSGDTPAGTDTAARRDNSAGVRSSSRASDSPHAASSPSRSSTGPGSASISGTSGRSRAIASTAPSCPPAARNSDDFPLPHGPVNSTRSPGRTSRVDAVGDGVRRLRRGEPEQVADDAGGQAAGGPGGRRGGW